MALNHVASSYLLMFSVAAIPTYALLVLKHLLLLLHGFRLKLLLLLLRTPAPGFSHAHYIVGNSPPP